MKKYVLDVDRTQRMLDAGLTMLDIAKEFKVNYTTLRLAMRRQGLKRKYKKDDELTEFKPTQRKPTSDTEVGWRNHLRYALRFGFDFSDGSLRTFIRQKRTRGLPQKTAEDLTRRFGFKFIGL